MHVYLVHFIGRRVLSCTKQPKPKPDTRHVLRSQGHPTARVRELGSGRRTRTEGLGTGASGDIREVEVTKFVG